MIATTIEWIRCLASPAHAQSTWLRIRRGDERKAVQVAIRVLIALFVACAIVWGIAYVRNQENMKMRQQLEMMIITGYAT